jgi:hypothetical protein
LCPCVDPQCKCIGPLRDGDELFQMCVASAAGAGLRACAKQTQSMQHTFSGNEFAVFVNVGREQGAHD